MQALGPHPVFGVAPVLLKQRNIQRFPAKLLRQIAVKRDVVGFLHLEPIVATGEPLPEPLLQGRDRLFGLFGL